MSGRLAQPLFTLLSRKAGPGVFGPSLFVVVLAVVLRSFQEWKVLYVCMYRVCEPVQMWGLAL